MRRVVKARLAGVWPVSGLAAGIKTYIKQIVTIFQGQAWPRSISRRSRFIPSSAPVDLAASNRPCACWRPPGSDRPGDLRTNARCVQAAREASSAHRNRPWLPRGAPPLHSTVPASWPGSRGRPRRGPSAGECVDELPESIAGDLIEERRGAYFTIGSDPIGSEKRDRQTAANRRDMRIAVNGCAEHADPFCESPCSRRRVKMSASWATGSALSPMRLRLHTLRWLPSRRPRTRRVRSIRAARFKRKSFEPALW